MRRVLALLSLLCGDACVDDVQVLRGGSVSAPSAPRGPAPSLLYRLDEGAGRRALDSSESGELIHLELSDPPPVWTADGLAFDGDVAAISVATPTAFVESCKRSNSLSVEAWVTPAVQTEEGTRRIVTLSAGSTKRNFSLGVGGLFSEGPLDVYSHRLRRGGGTTNGLPALYTPAGSVRPALTHVVAVYERGGRHRLYVDGAIAAERLDEGTLSNWDTTFRLGLGRELGEDDPRRGFVGQVHLVALYASALTADDVLSHFSAGPSW